MSKATAEKLKRLRRESGLSQTEAGALVHVSQRAWARYEAGTREPPRGVLELFCLKTNRDLEKEFPE